MANEAINTDQLFKDIVNNADRYGREEMGLGASIVGGMASPKNVYKLL